MGWQGAVGLDAPENPGSSAIDSEDAANATLEREMAKIADWEGKPGFSSVVLERLRDRAMSVML